MAGINPEEQLMFIDISRGAPTASDSSPPQSGGHFTGKLDGEYIWPFSIDSPKEVILPSGVVSNKMGRFTPASNLQREEDAGEHQL